MIEATLSLEQAASQPWDVVVVGAGPAGALAAGQLARQGALVLLVDRAAFPRAKVCGCCINPRALSALSAAGLDELTEQAGAKKLRSFCLAVGRRSAKVRLQGGVALSRSAFDGALVRAAIASGSYFLPSTTAELGPDTEDVRVVSLRQKTPHPTPNKPDAQARDTLAPPAGLLPEAERGEQRAGSVSDGLRGDPSPGPVAYASGSLGEGSGVASASCRVVLAADGLNSLLLSRGGVSEAPALPGSRIGAGVVLDIDDPFYEPGVIFMACGKAGYAGLVRLEDGRLDLACALDAGAVRAARGPAAVAKTLIADAGWPVPTGLDDQHWRGTVALTRQAERVADHRLFALGDATGYVEPFTGEGIGWALASAIAVTPLALHAIRDWQPGLAVAWRRLHQRVVTRRQFACRLLAAVLRRPWLTAAVVTVLARLPSLAVPVLHYLNDSNGVTRLPRAGHPLTLRDVP
jgi:flavin-dependent dehydrogenase